MVATNRRARHEYHIHDVYEAGLILHGSEVKSLRSGHLSINEAFGRVDAGEVWLVGMHVDEYVEANRFNHITRRRRKLLLHRAEIKKLEKKVKEKGNTLVPLEVYFNERGLAKISIALVSGKKLHDKREDIKKRDAEREMRRGR